MQGREVALMFSVLSHTSFAYEMKYSIQPNNTFAVFKVEDVVFCCQT